MGSNATGIVPIRELISVKSRLKQKNQVIWIAEDGVVYEEPSGMYAYKHYYNESEDML